MLGPRHLIQGVTSPESYRLAFERHVAQGRMRYPNLNWPRAWRSIAAVQPFVSGGSWKVACGTPGCTDSPLVAFEWGGLAICFACGVVYEGVAEPAERAEIERILLNRPHPSMRNWNWPIPETLTELRAQNREHGDAD